MGSKLEKNSESIRKRIESHTFENEEGDEYEGSKFGGFADYFRRKKIKLQNLDAEVRSSSTGNPQIFRGIVTHVNGYTQPSLNDLHHLVVSHGGGFMQYLDGKTTVTHIIAANLTPKKAIEFRQYRIVKPAWIVDSVNAGRLLPWDAYRVVDAGVGQRLLGFDDGKVVSQANTQQRTYREQTNTSWYTSQVKNVADNIDGEDGAQFPSSQLTTFNGTGAYLNSLADQPRKSIEVSSFNSNKDEVPTSPGSFEVTSSLEDAMNQAAREKELLLNAEDSTNQSRITDMLPEICAPSKPAERQPGSRDSLYEATVPTVMANSVPRKRSHEFETPSPSKKPKAMTAEEHNAILLADPHIRKSSTANPDFIKQYYSESRLHHLSTWKADLKLRFQQMAAEKSASQKPVKRKIGSRRYIMHVDFDSFFCAVSLLSAPEYLDKPAVVAHGSGTGSEIASCNYPARGFGVKNGMWMKKALELCPDIKVLPYDFIAYEDASKRFYESIIDVGGVVQSVSIDEALVDISALCSPAGGSDGFGIHEGSIWREQQKADGIANELRKRIKERTGCAVSIGIGANILLAKIALRKAKPAGQYQIKPEEVLDFVGELTLQDLPGVAYSISGKLEEIGVKFVKDVRTLSKERLMTVLGPKTGEKIWDYSRGIDKVEVGEQAVRKSVSAEVNWGIRFISQPEAEKFVEDLCGELQRRLVEQKFKGKQLTMKIMKKAADAPLDPPKHLGHGKCDTYNKSVVLGVATNSAEITGREAVSILRSYGFSPGELRGLGVQMTKLEPLKGAADGSLDGSQRRINFGKTVPRKPKTDFEDPIDDPKTPKKKREAPILETSKDFDPINEYTPEKPKAIPSRLLDSEDPIDDINSPKKARHTSVHPAAAISRANAADQSANKLLNLTGTQFILPSQMDPVVLAELPADIRSKLITQSKSRPVSRGESSSLKPVSRPNSPAIKSRSHSPLPAKLPIQLPPDFDLEVFNALPEEMKEEVLDSYRAQPSTPRKAKPGPPPVKKWTPTKKRGRPSGSKKKKDDPYPLFVQSNFVAAKASASTSTDENEELDPDFLSALPEDVRAEVIAEHKRARLAKRGGLITVANRKRRPPEVQIGARRLRLPKRAPKPTFTMRELSTLEELRETVSQWYGEFRGEGPHPEDVAAMERYLRRVVIEERDMAKVVGIVKWISWLMDDEESSEGEGARAWRGALESIKEKVQCAVQERGLGKLDLG